ncbi:MAG: ethylbenzene dehydrogenase-related protein [Candidatus Brocadia sp.]|nr:ethylbenzene dehydrogenase-related protein [Candidatus Brocadia sp.]
MAIHDLSGSSRAITALFVPGPITLNTADPAWAQAPEMTIGLGRRLHESGARLPSDDEKSRSVKVKVVHNSADIFFLCQWNQSAAHTKVDEYTLFADAFAMEIPLITEESPIWMGAADKPVNIIYWRADLPGPENIVGGGIGTTQKSPDATSQNIRHYQRWANGVWSLIITRPMSAASNNQVSFVRGESYRLAFANWKGGIDAERGGNKIVSDWQHLSIK